MVLNIAVSWHLAHDKYWKNYFNLFTTGLFSNIGAGNQSQLPYRFLYLYFWRSNHI